MLNVYYGKNCNVNVCTYTKELSVALTGRGKVFDYYLPDFDWNKDQLIFDFRDSDDLRLDEMTFSPCNGSSGCSSYDLFTFGTSGRYKVFSRTESFFASFRFFRCLIQLAREIWFFEKLWFFLN